jgi:hypothetical protein
LITLQKPSHPPHSTPFHLSLHSRLTYVQMLADIHRDLAHLYSMTYREALLKVAAKK